MGQDGGHRYAVGIDLGTTHCVLSRVDLAASGKTCGEILPIPQLIAPGQSATRCDSRSSSAKAL